MKENSTAGNKNLKPIAAKLCMPNFSNFRIMKIICSPFSPFPELLEKAISLSWPFSCFGIPFMLSLRTRQMPEMKQKEEGEKAKERKCDVATFFGASRENFSIKKIN